MRLPDLFKYNEVMYVLIKRKQTTVVLEKEGSEYDFGLVPQDSSRKDMELGKRRH